MSPTVRDFSISVRSGVSYQRALPMLREALKRHGFEILCELVVDREVGRKAGLQWEHLGLRWLHYTVFVVWSPSNACQALLSDRDAGLLIPFNLCAVDDGDAAFLAVRNHNGVLSPNHGPIGLQVLVRDLARKIREVLAEVAVQEERSEPRAMQTSALPGF